MLIRHISIPRKGYLATLKEPKQTTEKEEQVDYSNHLVRTLNPEYSRQDVLVEGKPIQQLKQQPTTSLFQTFAETSLLA